MVRLSRSAFRISKDKPRRVIQDVAAIDQFGELAAKKRHALETAAGHGHQMTPWHRRKNDPHGRWNSYCLDCNRLAVVAVEAAENLGDVYGKALTEACKVTHA